MSSNASTECPGCKMFFKDEFAMNIHLENISDMKHVWKFCDEYEIQTMSVNTIFKCNECNNVFKDKLSTLIHRRERVCLSTSTATESSEVDNDEPMVDGKQSMFDLTDPMVNDDSVHSNKADEFNFCLSTSTAIETSEVDNNDPVVDREQSMVDVTKLTVHDKRKPPLPEIFPLTVGRGRSITQSVSDVVADNKEKRIKAQILYLNNAPPPLDHLG